MHPENAANSASSKQTNGRAETKSSLATEPNVGTDLIPVTWINEPMDLSSTSDLWPIEAINDDQYSYRNILQIPTIFPGTIDTTQLSSAIPLYDPIIPPIPDSLEEILETQPRTHSYDDPVTWINEPIDLSSISDLWPMEAINDGQYNYRNILQIPTIFLGTVNTTQLSSAIPLYDPIILPIPDSLEEILEAQLRTHSCDDLFQIRELSRITGLSENIISLWLHNRRSRITRQW
ncbi:hypothetical protein ACOME3_005087 [Neoechinorhynchus agilis]